MRQAGRYLPEYRALRSRAGSFLSLCYTPSLAAEVTLQPLRRYDLDAAILFSDILVIPHALGIPLRFEAQEGPVLGDITLGEVASLEDVPTEVFHNHLAPVYEAINRVAQAILPTQDLIGFAGAPWTLACYMLEGKGQKNFLGARGKALSDPLNFERLLRELERRVGAHLAAQVKAGATVVQIFDSWSGCVGADYFEAWCLQPLQRIVGDLRSRGITVPIIYFPRGSGQRLEAIGKVHDVAGIGIDETTDIGLAKSYLPHKVLQGNLDPALMLAHPDGFEDHIYRLLDKVGEHPHIFNLGHGVDKNTQPDTLGRVIDIVRGY